jgi:cardiolipin synthase
MPWVAGSFYKELLSSGVKIYEYLPRFLHSKSVIIDDWVVVGSSNMNRRSMLKDFEVDIVLKKTNSIDTCIERFEKDLGEAAEIRGARGGITALFGRVIISFMKNWI